MSYGIWGRVKERESRAVNEKTYRRAPLPAWDARWHALSVPARFAFVNEVKGPPMRKDTSTRPSVPIDRVPREALDELTAAGFVEVQKGRGGAAVDRVFAVKDVADFASRVRGLARYHLLDPKQPSKFETYFNACFYPTNFYGIMQGVLSNAGVDELSDLSEALRLYILRRHWPEWAARSLNDPVAERIVAEARGDEAPIPLVELPGRIAGATPEAVRASMDALLARLALVEDLDPATLELQVGLLPAVREDMDKAGRPRERPPLPICEAPKELGPDESIMVGDLRAVLLEVASEPPRLRQDRSLFQKEIDRFTEVLEPLPAWLADFLHLTPEGRLERALQWANHLKLVKEAVSGKQIDLQLASRGEGWLGEDEEARHAELIGVYRSPTSLDRIYELSYIAFGRGFDPFSYYTRGDQIFLGSNVAAFPSTKERRFRSLYEAKPKDFEPLRDALDRTFTSIPVGTFYRLDGFLDHFAFREHNPICLGRPPEEGRVAVFKDGRQVPALEDRREEVGRELLETFVRSRLIPLGCLRAAIDDEGRFCVAREPRLDAYFGRKVAPGRRADGSKAASEASRVVVQPDFSIVIIGTNPAPAAALIPFCERTTRGGARGAIVLKLTRESVVGAVARGMKPSEVMGRLKKHASQDLPANVVREVEGWAAWVREVNPETLTVIRCPDRETADRVMSALRTKAERVRDTMIAIEPTRLTAVERKKLQDQGIILGKPARPGPEPKAKRKKSRRRY